MKKIIILILLLCVSYGWAVAQQKIVLRAPKQFHTKTYLYDDDNNFMLTLPLTFSITDKNILVMMMGNDTALLHNKSVWIFVDEMYFADLMKNDHNISASKSFLKDNTELNAFLLPNRKVSLFRTMDDGYETVKKNAKPILFEINEPIATQPVTFYLQCYVTQPNSKYLYNFIAKCKPIEIELTIK
jgi:hypothetical protein